MMEPNQISKATDNAAIKICGLSSREAIDAAIEAGASYVGFVHFPKSPRHVSLEVASALAKYAQSRIKTVLLLVNADPSQTETALRMVRPHVIQFHGNETPEWLALVKQHFDTEIWKALGVTDAETLKSSDRFVGSADRLLFDAPAQALPGGTGMAFDWKLLSSHEHKLPWGLAGGLTPDNVADAISATGANMVDTSSGVESAPGVKEMDKISAFCHAVCNLDKSI